MPLLGGGDEEGNGEGVLSAPGYGECTPPSGERAEVPWFPVAVVEPLGACAELDRNKPCDLRPSALNAIRNAQETNFFSTPRRYGEAKSTTATAERCGIKTQRSVRTRCPNLPTWTSDLDQVRAPRDHHRVGVAR